MSLFELWRAQPGSQELFMRCPYREVCYAGTRGPGKTSSMLMAFAQHCGKGFGMHWRGIIFRREYKHLDDIINKSKQWFNRLPSPYRPRFLSGQGQMKWVWPGGEELLFRTFNTVDDYWNYHGHEYCVEVGTPVLTPSGYVPIESLKVGDEVVTPGGVDRVTRTFTPKVKECVTASFYDDHRNLVARQVQSVTHRLLTSAQTPCKSSGSSSGSVRQSHPQNLSWHSYKSLLDADPENLEAGASQTGANSSGAGGSWTPPGGRRTLAPSGEVSVPCEPWPRSGGSDPHPASQFRAARKSIARQEDSLADRTPAPSGLWLPPEPAGSTPGHRAFDVLADEHCLTQKALDSQAGCHCARHFGDAPPPAGEGSDRDGAPSPGGAAVRARAGLLLDAAAPASTRSRCDAGSFFENPYDPGSRVPAEGVGFLEVELVPCGERLTVDISVGKNKLYITQGGIINSNCFIGWEELTSWPSSDCYESMMSCNRSSYHARPGQPGIPLMVRSTTNPYGVGHNWVKQYFIDPAPYGHVIRNAEGQARVCLFGSVFENKFLDAGYINTLKAISEPNKRKAWLYGSWDITSGGMFDDLWDRDRHVLPALELPASWRVDRALDWGSSRPFSVGWWAESDGTPARVAGQERPFARGTLIRLAEWYGCTGKPNEGVRLTASAVAEGIKQREAQLREAWQRPGLNIRPGPADAAIYAVTDDVSIGQNMARAGVTWTPADKRAGSRKNGWELMRARLEAVTTATGSGDDQPGLYVLENCRDFLRTVPSIARDGRDPDDVDSDAEDHCADETRYRCLAPRREASSTTLRM